MPQGMQSALQAHSKHLWLFPPRGSSHATQTIAMTTKQGWRLFNPSGGAAIIQGQPLNKHGVR